MGYATKNYTKPGGNETVIGGKLTVEEGAMLQGLPTAAYQADAGADANTVALLRAEHNKLLGKLRDAMLMAAAPTITVTAQPADLSLIAGSIDADDKLTAAFAASNGGALTYQWYSNSTDSNEGSNAVSGATEASYSIPTDATAGTTYYYCVASHEGVTATSETATVTIANDA